jgi:RIO kinase 1
MKAPARLVPLIEEGLVDGVVRQLMSGKEAMVYVVRCGDDARAKVTRKRPSAAFAKRSTTPRTVRSRTPARHAPWPGHALHRQAQKRRGSAEVDAASPAAAGVACPPYNFHALLMELVVDGDGAVAPRLNDVAFSAEQARAHHAALMREVVRMLCAGVVHGDLSEFNILLAGDGPVIIDLPQAVDAAGNNHAKRMLLRDVANLRDFFGRFAPELLATRHGEEIWALFERGVLQPATPLSGRFEEAARPVDVAAVLREVNDSLADEAEGRAVALAG